MRVIGTPNQNSKRIIDQLSSQLVLSVTKKIVDNSYLETLLNLDSKVLDVGKSLRENFSYVEKISKNLQTLDINIFQDYPDIHMDLCQEVELPEDLKFNVIFCFSFFEHCYNPHMAAKNLFQMLEKDGKIVGSAPFLFPYHCPEDLSYQDYFRFTHHSFAALFPHAVRINIYPHRGRVGAGLNIISQRYKDWFEKYFPKLSNRLNQIDQQRKPENTSGFHFEVFR